MGVLTSAGTGQEAGGQILAENKAGKEVSILPAIGGWVVHVGCKVFVFVDPRKLCRNLERYLKDPKLLQGVNKEEDLI